MVNLLFHLHICVYFGPSIPPSCSPRLSRYLIQPAIVFIALQKEISPHTGAMGCGINPGGPCAAGQTRSGGWLDLRGGSAFPSSSMIHCGSSRRAAIPRLRDPMAPCWGSLQAKQQGLYKFCRKRQGWICNLDLTEPFLPTKGRWLHRHHVCGRTCTHLHTGQAGNATMAGQEFV